MGSTFTQGQCFKDAFAFADAEVTVSAILVVMVDFGLKLCQSTHNNFLHFVSSEFLRLAFQFGFLNFECNFFILFLVFAVALLQLIDFLDQQLVLHLQVVVLVSEDALDVGVLAQLLLDHRWVPGELLLVWGLGGQVHPHWTSGWVFGRPYGADAQLFLLGFLHGSHGDMVWK